MTEALTAAERASDRWFDANAAWFQADGRRCWMACTCEQAGTYEVTIAWGVLALREAIAVEREYDSYDAGVRREYRADIRRHMRGRLDHHRRFIEAVGHVAGGDGASEHRESYA